MSTEDKIFWAEFLQLYKSMPSLWKIKSPEYSNRKLKTKCYEKMVRKLKEKDPHANRDKVIKKINVFRTNYKRELKKKLSNENQGTNGEFRSSLWYFDKLKFLDGQHCGEDDQCDNDNKNFNHNTYVEEKIMATSQSKKHKLALEDNLLEMTTSPAKKRKFAVEDNLLEIACQKLINTDEASSVLSKGWALQYKELSKEQQVYTRIIIADVLFHGCLHKITEKTVEDIHKVLQGISVQNYEHSDQASNDYIEEYENASNEEHLRSPSLEKTEAFF